MKAHYKTASGRLVFEVAGETVKDLFKQVATVQEVFEAEEKCGCCNAPFIRLQVRTVEDNEFYELVCNACHARFAFGQHKKGGGLFPKRRAEDGKPLANGGWAKWQGRQEG